MITVLIGLITFVAGALAGYFLSGSSPVANQKAGSPGSSGADKATRNGSLPEDAIKAVSDEAQDLLDIAIAQSVSVARQSRGAEDTALKAMAYDSIKSEWEQVAGIGGDMAVPIIRLAENPYSGAVKSERPATEAGRSRSETSEDGTSQGFAEGPAHGFAGHRTEIPYDEGGGGYGRPARDERPEEPGEGLADKLAEGFDDDIAEAPAASGGSSRSDDGPEDLESLEDLEEL